MYVMERKWRRKERREGNTLACSKVLTEDNEENENQVRLKQRTPGERFWEIAVDNEQMQIIRQPILEATTPANRQTKDKTYTTSASNFK